MHLGLIGEYFYINIIVQFVRTYKIGLSVNQNHLRNDLYRYSKEILIRYIPALEVQLSCVIMKLESSHEFSSYCIKLTKKYLHLLKSVGIVTQDVLMYSNIVFII